MLSHQKNPKFPLAQKLVGLTSLILLAFSFGPQPAAAKQKSAAEVAKSKSADVLAPVKEALTKAVAAHFLEDLNGKKTKQFFEGWTDSDWESFLNKNFGFYAGASKLKAGEPDLEQLQQELYKKHSTHLTGAIAETFHWVQWRKKIEQIAKDERYTEVEFLDEKALMTIFGKTGGQRCDGIAIAKNNGNPPKRVILGVFESKVSASQVDPIQIENFLVRIRNHYRDKDVSLIRLSEGQTKLIENINDYDAKNIIEAAKEFHKEAARLLTEKDSIRLLLNTVSREFAGNVMKQTTEQKKKLFDISLPLKELAEFIRDNKRFPIYRKDASEAERTLANWVYDYFEEYEKEIKDYLTGPGGIEEAKLDWMLEVRAARWKKELPDLAEFIRVNKRFPIYGKDASEKEKTLAIWLRRPFSNEKKSEILDYLRGPGGVDEATLDWALEVRANPWKEQLPDFAKFVRDNKQFPRQNGKLDGEDKLATFLSNHFESEKKKPEILVYLEKHVDKAVLKKALEDFEKKKRAPRRNKIPATDANPGLGECDGELEGILSELSPAA